MDASSDPRGSDSLAETPRPVSGTDQTIASKPQSTFSPATTGRHEISHISRYEIRRRLGVGGMGVVYEGFDSRLGRRIAIKVLKSTKARSDARARLRREAQALAQLSHPNVVQVYEVDEHGDELFVAMEFVEGQTLGEWMRANQGDPRAIIDMFVQAGEGLVAAHRRSLVHRDFKPDNVLVGEEDGRARVLDFGLAMQGNEELLAAEVEAATSASTSGSDRDLTATGTIMGTPAYMAPEQFRGLKATPATDQFSFCVALWQGLCGQRPFSGKSHLALMMQVNRGDITDPPAGAMSPTIEQTLRRGLLADPDDRWPSMEALIHELRGGQLTARRRPSRIVVLGTALIVTILGGGVFLGSDDLFEDGVPWSDARVESVPKMNHAVSFAAQADRLRFDGRGDEAIARYGKALELEERPEWVLELAQLHELEDHHEEARDAYQRYIEIAVPRTDLAPIHARIEDLDAKATKLSREQRMEETRRRNQLVRPESPTANDLVKAEGAAARASDLLAKHEWEPAAEGFIDAFMFSGDPELLMPIADASEALGEARAKDAVDGRTDRLSMANMPTRSWSTAQTALSRLSALAVDDGRWGDPGALTRRIEDIERRKVEFSDWLKGQRKQPAELPAEVAELVARSISCTRDTCRVRSELIDRFTRDTSVFESSARIVPAVHDGKRRGFKLYGVKPNTALDRLGLANGDMITKVGDMDLSKLDNVEGIAAHIESRESLVVRFEREGTERERILLFE